MPKDATKNIDRYKIRGGQLNEFEYAENQKALAGKKGKTQAKLIPGTPPEKADEGLQPTVKAKASIATKGAKSTNQILIFEVRLYVIQFAQLDHH